MVTKAERIALAIARNERAKEAEIQRVIAKWDKNKQASIDWIKNEQVRNES